MRVCICAHGRKGGYKNNCNNIETVTFWTLRSTVYTLESAYYCLFTVDSWKLSGFSFFLIPQYYLYTRRVVDRFISYTVQWAAGSIEFQRVHLRLVYSRSDLQSTETAFHLFRRKAIRTCTAPPPRLNRNDYKMKNIILSRRWRGV